MLLMPLLCVLSSLSVFYGVERNRKFPHSPGAWLQLLGLGKHGAGAWLILPQRKTLQGRTDAPIQDENVW